MTAGNPQPAPAAGDRARGLAAHTALPVLLLAVCLVADVADRPTLTTGFDGDPRRHIPTAYEDGQRAEVPASRGQDHAQFVAAVSSIGRPGRPATPGS
ncbi:hypothetical protein ACWGKU_04825 [Kitasatospora sp. NPDC054768]